MLLVKKMRYLLRTTILPFFFVSIIASISVSCDKSVFYGETHHLKTDGWNAADTLFYTFNSADTLASYDFYFEVRNTTDYNMQNLYFFITAFYPGNTFSRDTAECLLAGPDGKWYGKGLGKHRDSRFLFRKGVRFRKKGTYVIAVNQAMRIEKLYGISEVGILIKKQAD